MFLLNRLTLIGMYVAQWREESKAQILQENALKLARYNVRILGVSSVMWLLATFLPPGWQMLIWGVALGIDVLLTALGKERLAGLSPHPEHLPERVQQLTLISLGSIITKLVSFTC